jgi:hypothetical protein
MRRLLRFILPSVLLLGLSTWAFPASADHNADNHFNMFEEFTSPNQATNSDLAFWGDYAFVGYYTGAAGFPPGTGSRGGVRIFDISNPASPVMVRNFACDGAQNDPIVWDRDGDGVPDLLLLAVDTTMASPACGAARVPGGTPTGWEGIRIIEMSDDPANPFATMQQVGTLYQDCGSHTITLWQGKADQGELIVYSSSYPLGAGPTCGDTEFLNTANPYDTDPGSPNSPLHGVIQVNRIPLANPAAATEIAQPAISYQFPPATGFPSDPDGIMQWSEKGLPSPPFEPGAIACHDIVVHMEHNLAGAACAEQGQVWEIDPNTGIPDTLNPVSVGDDEVSSGGTGQFPGAVDFFHSVMFDNEGEVVNWVDESFGSGCPPMTNYQSRPWNPAGGTHKTGRMFFSELDGTFLSEFHVGDVRPSSAPGEYCSAHMGMAVMGIQKDLLVNAWYTGGVDVIDFSDASILEEVAWYDPVRNSGSWSAYPYTGPMYSTGPGIPVYASDGVTNNGLAQGMVVYRTILQKPGKPALVDHLNPQTMD